MSSKRLLVVDDSREFQALMSAYFSEAGFSVQGAANGEEGVRLALSGKPDAILLDIMMPEMGGIEVLRKLASDPATSAIPVVMITGVYFDRTVGELVRREPNCRDFLSKTSELSYILSRVRAAMGEA